MMKEKIDVSKNVKNEDISQEIVVSETPAKESYSAKIKNCSLLNIRKEPSLESEILKVVDVNEELLVEETVSDGFCHVTLANGVEGFAKEEFLEKL